MNTIALNFLPLKSNDFSFFVFRRKVIKNESKPELINVFKTRLPENDNQNIFIDYWVSFDKFNDSEEYNCKNLLNINLTKAFIFWKLKKHVTSVIEANKFEINPKTRYKRINFILNTHNEGKEAVTFEPYYLEITKQFGFLYDFTFLKKEGIDFNRKVQILSLSLDSNGRSNTSFYSDKFNKMKIFSKLYYKKIFENMIFDFISSIELPCKYLTEKILLVANNREISSQNKIRNIGPFKEVESVVNIFFLHKESERKIISGFYSELQNELLSIFKSKSILHGHRCNNISESEIVNLRENIILNKYSNPIVIILKKDQSEEDELYYSAKHKFSEFNIPVQFINYNTLDNKYSVRDYSLQIFSKVGGIPWLVKTGKDKTLIIGLAQSINYSFNEDKRSQEKYYAYSILLENSGLYNSIDIVTSNSSKSDYLHCLKIKIKSILQQHSKNYNKIVIHAPFKISKDEIEMIKDSISVINSSIEFVVIKINVRNKYFGYNKSVNNLTPLAGTCIAIGKYDYLLWSEGLLSDNLISKKRYSGPIHISFMFQNQSSTDHILYIQELLNLSGMNWRAYNSKSIPISVQYCELVSEFVKQFKNHGYPDLTAASLQPWFL